MPNYNKVHSGFHKGESPQVKPLPERNDRGVFYEPLARGDGQYGEQPTEGLARILLRTVREAINRNQGGIMEQIRSAGGDLDKLARVIDSRSRDELERLLEGYVNDLELNLQYRERLSDDTLKHVLRLIQKALGQMRGCESFSKQPSDRRRPDGDGDGDGGGGEFGGFGVAF